jgi:multiple sugar transport system permease protein
MSRSSRSPVKTAIGVVITAVMLFPLYWMINVSLTPDDRLRQDNPQLFPVHLTGAG